MQDKFSKFTLIVAEINRSINKIKSEEMARFNLKGTHVSCLYYLYVNGSLTAKELCDICQEDKAAISRTIDYLEKNGYIYCESTAQKRYKSPLKLTEKGYEVGCAMSDIIADIVKEANSELSEWDLMTMYQGLYSINGKLKNLCSKYENRK